ncbi:Protein of unknown function, partial [Gryllus bimaculatus]
MQEDEVQDFIEQRQTQNSGCLVWYLDGFWSFENNLHFCIFILWKLLYYTDFSMMAFPSSAPVQLEASHFICIFFLLTHLLAYLKERHILPQRIINKSIST